MLNVLLLALAVNANKCDNSVRNPARLDKVKYLARFSMKPPPKHLYISAPTTLARARTVHKLIQVPDNISCISQYFLCTALLIILLSQSSRM